MASRHFALYFSWSRPQEELRSPLGVLENRYPSLFEFRRALWPQIEQFRDQALFDQGIAGFLDHVVLSDFEVFRKFIKGETGNEVPVIQREGDKPPTGQLDDSLLRGVDTLIVVSLDHYRTSQQASRGEIDLVSTFLQREGRCVVVCPHHDIGAQGTIPTQQIEFDHHGDQLVPAQQRIGGFARSLLDGLGLCVENQFGLSPEQAPDGSPAPLVINHDLDLTGVLRGVSTFNLHPHLPHLALPTGIDTGLELLAQQRINSKASKHPFFEAGNRTFNAFLQSRPDRFPGKVFVCDATLWSSAFGGLASLQAFWRNLSQMPV